VTTYECCFGTEHLNDLKAKAPRLCITVSARTKEDALSLAIIHTLTQHPYAVLYIALREYTTLVWAVYLDDICVDNFSLHAPNMVELEAAGYTDNQILVSLQTYILDRLGSDGLCCAARVISPNNLEAIYSE